jgi:hypothetical protein
MILGNSMKIENNEDNIFKRIQKNNTTDIDINI